MYPCICVGKDYDDIISYMEYIYIWICRVCIQGNLDIILSTYNISLYKNSGLRGLSVKSFVG